MRVVQEGNPDGEPTLLIHGFMSSNLQWEQNLSTLGRDLRLIMIELPGHGGSPAPAASTDLDPDVILGAIEEIRNERGIDRWWVVGHSFGGAIGIRYALAHPDNTHGLVFTNSRAAFGVKRSDGPVRPTGDGDLRALPFHPIHAKRFPADLKAQMVAVADGMDPVTIACVVESATAWRSGDELDQLSVPVLLVNGQWEKAFQPNADQAQRLIPSLRRVDLEGGHSINIERPREFEEAVLDFVRSSRDAGLRST